MDWKQKADVSDALGHGLKEGEFKAIRETLGREISILELGIASALFSEHCSYKSTKTHLKNLPTTGPRVIIGPGENAGVVDIDDNDVVVFKVESHNHPTFIEPFQGAATGVGGILRDVFTMGARPIALMNGLRFGDPKLAKTSYLLSRAVAGIGTYGNCMGIPTVGGELYFHKSYDGNCLVNAFALGVAKKDKIFLGRAAGVGNSIVYLGSKTGRDGIHGATMASDTFEEDSDEKRPTVQVGDPFQEKLLLEACLEIMQLEGLVGIQDMGAAGLTSSSYEMAERGDSGVRIHLDRVPQREDGMNPYELMLSESQERMLLVCKPEQEAEIIKRCTRWELDAVKIGEVIEGDSVELYWHGECISSMPVKLFLTAVPEYRWPEEKPKDSESRNTFDVNTVDIPKDLSSVWLSLVASPNACSRRPIYIQYDSTIGASTVLHPGGDAGVVRIPGSETKGVAMSLDCNSLYVSIDPRLGTAHAVAEGFRNITASGARPIGISNCLNFGNPEKPERMYEIAESIRGLGDASRAFQAPVVSGNVSLYNETVGRPILPTPTIAMVGLVSDVSTCVPSCFVDPGDRVLVIGETNPVDLGGSLYFSEAFGIEKGALPIVHYEKETRHAEFILDLLSKKLLKSCHDISQGGLALALVEASISDYSALGVELQVEKFKGRQDGLLFAETGARYIISADPAHETAIRALATERSIAISLSGKVGGKDIRIGSSSLRLDNVVEKYRHGLEAIL